MKTLFIGLMAIGFLSLYSCQQEKDPKALMENPEKRTAIYNAIVENDDYTNEFMESMHGNEHTMEMMRGNEKMMGAMMKGQGLQLMMKDSTMMHSMMDGMMKDGKMMGQMMKMMHEKGMMSEDCMELCTKMMSNKGMDMKEISKMDTSKKDDHNHH